MELSSFNIKKFLIFSQNKALLIFQETETPKKCVIFREKELSYISGNGNPKKILILRKELIKSENQTRSYRLELLTYYCMPYSLVIPFSATGLLIIHPIIDI